MRINNQGLTFISEACPPVGGLSEVRKSGFTFIELLVSITIILVLTSIGMVSYQSANKGARDNKRKADLEQVRAALEMYRTDNDAYPAVASWGAMITALGDYLNEEPEDPKGYSYYYSGSNYSYDLCTYLESDSSGNCGSASCGSETCNYKLTNP